MSRPLPAERVHGDGMCVSFLRGTQLWPRPVEILPRIVGRAMADRAAANAAGGGGRDVGCSGHRVRRSVGGLAAAESGRSGMVRRSQRTRLQQEGSPATEALSLTRLDETIRQNSID